VCLNVFLINLFSLFLCYRELSHFVLETNRPDAKNALYQATIKQGDFPLNRIEKLSRVIDL